MKYFILSMARGGFMIFPKVEGWGVPLLNPTFCGQGPGRGSFGF